MNDAREPIGVHGQLPPAHPVGVTHADAERLREYALDYESRFEFAKTDHLNDLAARIDAGLRQRSQQ